MSVELSHKQPEAKKKALAVEDTHSQQGQAWQQNYASRTPLLRAASRTLNKVGPAEPSPICYTPHNGHAVAAGLVQRRPDVNGHQRYNAN